MEIENSLVVQLRQQVHLPESRGFPLASRTNELRSELGLSLFLSHPLHIGEGTPASNSGNISGVNNTYELNIRYKLFLHFNTLLLIYFRVLEGKKKTVKKLHITVKFFHFKIVPARVASLQGTDQNITNITVWKFTLDLYEQYV